MRALGQTTRASAKKVKAGSTRGESFPAEESRRTLNEAIDGQSVELDFITEGGERDVRLLSFLQEHGMRPGAKVHVLDVAPSLGMMTLKVGEDAFSLGIEAAKKIRVH